LLFDSGELVADVVDRHAHHQLDRFEARAMQERELVIDRSEVKTFPA